MAWKAHRGGMRRPIQRGALGHARSAPSKVPMAKESSVVVPSRPMVQGIASAMISRTVRG